MSNSPNFEVQLDGIDGFIMFVKKGGKYITLAGFNHLAFEIGRNVILHQQDGTSTRYKILKVNRPPDPGDQYFLDLEFNPR